jgi:hypothetical protein
MDDTNRVLERLARIERLRATAPPSALPGALLDELRQLVPEAEAEARARARAEATTRGASAVEKVGEEAEGMR